MEVFLNTALVIAILMGLCCFGVFLLVITAEKYEYLSEWVKRRKDNIAWRKQLKENNAKDDEVSDWRKRNA